MRQSRQHTSVFFFFNDTATTEIYTLSLHDALPISARRHRRPAPGYHGARDHPRGPRGRGPPARARLRPAGDRKSTRLNSSHGYISYAVFCLKKKNEAWLRTSTLLHYADFRVERDRP